MKSVLYIFLLLFSRGVLCSQDSLEIEKHFSRFLDYTIQVKYSKNGLEWKIPSRYYPENHKSLRNMYVMFQGFNDNKYNNIDTLITQIKATMDSAGLKSNPYLPLNFFCVKFYKCNDTFLQALFHSGILGTKISSLDFVRCGMKSVASLSNQEKIESIGFYSKDTPFLFSDIDSLYCEQLHFEDIDTLILFKSFQKIKQLKMLSFNNVNHLIVGDVFLPQLHGLAIVSSTASICYTLLNKFFIFPNLTGLFIENTPLETIPPVIANFRGLKSLALERANVSEIPDFLCTLDKLNHISFIDIPITTIPECLSELRYLSHIQINKLRIRLL